MSINYSFTDKKTGEKIPLNDVDDLIRNETNNHEDMEHYCPEFNILVNLGIQMVWSRSDVTKENFDNVMYRYEISAHVDDPNQSDEALAKIKDLARRFLYEEYTFEAWR